MKHAMMIQMHNNVDVVNDTMRMLDDDEITFFILIDSKSKINKDEFVMPKLSKVFFLPQRNILWGHHSQVEAELALLEAAQNFFQSEKAYFHLMSGADFPLLKSNEFKNFFDDRYPKEFVRFENKDIINKERLERIKFYYPTLNVNFPRFLARMFIYTSVKVQKPLKINRMNKPNFPKWTFQSGDQWFSITNNLASELILYRKEILEVFKNSRASDELFVQTILRSSDLYSNVSSNDEGSLRLIDWNRGHPYTFTDENLSEIINAKKNGAVFIRKLNADSSKGIRNTLLHDK